MSESQPGVTKPLLRGHFHQAAFFLALGACAVLLARSRDERTFLSVLIYSITLVTLFGVSALYHRKNWKEKARMWMRRLDHSSIFLLIAGTATPICRIALPEQAGLQLLKLLWSAATVGVFLSLFWVRAPKWISALLCLVVGWTALPYMPQFRAALNPICMDLIFLGGILYTAGALIYAFKKPNPMPRVFGYHEIFHVLVVFGAAFHFAVIDQLVK